MRISCVLLLQCAFPVCALGFRKAEITDTVGFVREDNQRDTISLLLSCFAILGLCVYSAVHLNVPRKGESSIRVLVREFKWCIIGLFAPELILYTAWRQLASARQLCYKINDIQTNNPTEAEDQRLISMTRWALPHGFHGSMGGFAIDLETTDDPLTSLFGSHKRLSLTAKGFALLAECGHISEVSVDEIKDKNKADGLAKLLVCIQAGWMIVQITSRAATGLATTLLEVHTVAHVVCALVMYVLWWHKPRQVGSPTLLKGDWLLPLAMYMFLASRFPFIDSVWVAYNERKLSWFAFGFITLRCILCGISYMVSRAYLVVEAFVSIRRVPSEVYQTPAWLQVFPHL
ncbi:uncharacterized protein M421DRAFT_393038 [Didymella exigua CBS 183.55]|uniref:Uncharacterized protein n=1 Tax=Didymella exigua CBS 183.55 TaxID=1150837 RepID=A0A6A5RIU1_9PLEO|nr:uncharacterized protein M421DRAFT_393038 [Didymella exigua CBS 183.55]KAF1927529.1 hypothetical protein M421DRAFT_393038 [Didymella exigua CBS 183.55]